MAKGNIPIDKDKAKTIEDGKIVKELPLVPYNGELVHLFSIDVPEICPKCSGKLNKNKEHDRYILTSEGTLERPVVYKRCKVCGNPVTSKIVGVDGPNNYAEELLLKSKESRHKAKNSLNDTRKIAEIFGGGIKETIRAPCQGTLWEYEQRVGKQSLKKLRETEVSFNGTLHIDGFWTICGWRKFVEEGQGQEFSDREWKRFKRQKVIYVVATDDKVILDFIITNPKPPSFCLYPLLNRIKERLGEENIEKVVSDEDKAIIDAVNTILPNAAHGFCIFHQLKNWTEKFLDQFESLDDLPIWANKLYEKGIELIKAEDAVTSSKRLTEAKDLLDGSPSKGFIEFKDALIDFLEKKYEKNRTYLEKGYLPDTNNIMEQLFAFLESATHRLKSFKTLFGLKSWVSIQFYSWNNREFYTGNHAGFTPLEIDKSKDPPAS